MVLGNIYKELLKIKRASNCENPDNKLDPAFFVENDHQTTNPVESATRGELYSTRLSRCYLQLVIKVNT